MDSSRVTGGFARTNSAVEQIPHGRRFAAAADNRINALPQLPRQPRHARGRFPFESLLIETALARDHYIRPLDGRFEIEHLGDEIETRPNGRTAKTHQTETQSTGRASPGGFPKIATQVSCHDIGKSRESFLEHFNLIWRDALLRAKCSRRASCSEQRIFHVGRGDHVEEGM